jgi:hypothetical protein
VAARFQVVTVVPPGPRDRSANAAAARVYSWSFLTANNRRLATAATTFTQVQACLDAIRALQEGLPEAVGVLVQVAPARWMWRLSLSGTDCAMSGHAYARRVRAQLAYELFMSQVPTAGSTLSARVRSR